MRNVLVPIAFAAALVAAAPASAQRASLADRVAALEQRAADNQGNVDLLNQLTALRREVQALRSQIEELQQQNEQLKSSNRSQYLDLDGRLNRLEGTAPATLDPNAVPAPSASAPAAAPAIRDVPPTIHGDPGSLSKMADERGAYETAFNALKTGQYAQSAS